MARAWAMRMAAAAIALIAILGAAVDVAADSLVETPSLEAAVGDGRLPPLAERLPAEPLVVDLAAHGRRFGRHGGALRMLISRTKDARYATAYGYARLVGVEPDLTLGPDILRAVEVIENRIFTLRLRKGHKWSDGHPFTSEDFRYWWQDVANNPELSPAGPPSELLVDGAPPQVRFPDELTVVFEWPSANPRFLKMLARAAPPFIYRPAHYLKKFHAKYTDAETLKYAVAGARARSWAALHNALDNMYRGDNPDLPSLQPWIPTAEGGETRVVWRRNPFYHRVDASGRQLPYIDSLDMNITAAGLIPTKTQVGEVDLQAKGLPFSEAAALKAGEAERGYRLLVWRHGVASEVAIYPNLNHVDPGFRALFRDRRFRQALSLGIRRDVISRTLYFEFASPVAQSMLPSSPLYDPAHASAFAVYDLARGNALLDEIGLTKRGRDGVRLLPDGRPLEIVIETPGERVEVEKMLQIIARSWGELGVKLLVKPSDRDILRNRVYAGEAMMATWFGWDNGQATALDPPDEQTPRRQDTLCWPKWGQYFQTGGAAGEPIDDPSALRLEALAQAWERAEDDAGREAAWREILAIHAEEVFTIGVVNAAPVLVVASAALRNVPEQGMWSWDPGSHFGIYRIDEFYFAE